MKYPNFKVTVSCMTYNQSKYITDAMNGFTMQQTSFPFVCTIVDDASTDGEQEVIRKYVEDNFDFSEGSVAYHKETDYAHITYAQHKTNKNCYFAVLYLKENHYSKHKDKSPYLKDWRDGVEYMAICEGDDYWIDSQKLQKQVEFLDNNPAYGKKWCNDGENNYLLPIEDIINQNLILGMIRTPEHNRKISEANRGKIHNYSSTQGRVCYNNGINNRFINKDDISYYESNGWIKGMINTRWEK